MGTQKSIQQKYDVIRWAGIFKELGVRTTNDKPSWGIQPEFFLPDYQCWVVVWDSTTPREESRRELGDLHERTGKAVIELPGLDCLLWEPAQTPKLYGNLDERRVSFKTTDPTLQARVENGLGKRMFTGYISQDWRDEVGISEEKSWGTAITCPICCSPLVHFEEPTYKATDDYDAWEGRGSALRVPMYCESNHAWTMRLGFHKGTSYFRIEDVQTILCSPFDIFTLGDHRLLGIAIEKALSRFPYANGPTFRDLGRLLGKLA